MCGEQLFFFCVCHVLRPVFPTLVVSIATDHVQGQCLNDYHNVSFHLSALPPCSTAQLHDNRISLKVSCEEAMCLIPNVHAHSATPPSCSCSLLNDQLHIIRPLPVPLHSSTPFVTVVGRPWLPEGAASGASGRRMKPLIKFLDIL